MKYNQFVHSYTGGGWLCVCARVHECVHRWVGGGADGQHRLVLVWGLDQSRFTITDPLQGFRDPLSVSFDLWPPPYDSCQSCAGIDGTWLTWIPCCDTEAHTQRKYTQTHHLLLSLPHTFCCLFYLMQGAEVEVGAGGGWSRTRQTEPWRQGGGGLDFWRFSGMSTPCASSSNAVCSLNHPR